MSRLTGSDVQSMMEAYNAVYAPQEENVLDENKDCEELEEVCEEYIEEQGAANPTVSRLRSGGPGREAPKPAPSMSYAERIRTRMDARTKGRSTTQPTTTPAAPKPAPTAPRPAATAPRPAATAPRPAAPAKPTPTAPRPAAGQTGDKAKDMATWSKTFPKLAAKVTPSGTQAGTGQSQMAKQAAELRAMRQRSQERQGVKTEEYDAYDLVLEYLLAEGHADTVEEANYVMLEMDAEMVQSIVESYLIEEETPLQKIRRRNKEYFRNNPETVQKTTQRRAEHKAVRGEKKEKGAKSVFGTMRHIGGPYR